MRGFVRGAGLAVALGVLATAAVPSPRSQDDLRVRAFIEAYRELIDSVRYDGRDVVFSLGRGPIHFQGGRMLGADRLDRTEQCDPIFYPYSLEPLTRPLPPPVERPTPCTDLLESLWGKSEREIRGHGRSVSFLDHRMFVNELLVDPLAAIERDILAAAARDTSIATWVAQLDITYSFADREIAGSETRSYHAWGLAIDLVPSSYDGGAVYWRWSRVFNREDWHQIPIEGRWSPPQYVIETFEDHGFVWGGKWAHFDVIHFEYRPAVLLYNRMIAE
ncbi:MAG: M15 family metallopeptidase [Gemmatimonadota bacterium]|nr:M15 family metallopeptidase [Gemmatimonadota bacterium]MDH3422748.1 M15 family metallopeptidase [Gemmatimonadota bacterium]